MGRVAHLLDRQLPERSRLVRLWFSRRPSIRAAPSASVRGSKRLHRLRDVSVVDAVRRPARRGKTAGPSELALRERVWKASRVPPRTAPAICSHM